MKKIKDLIKANQDQLASDYSKYQQPTSEKTDLPIHWITEIFKRFQRRYGTKWVASIEGIEAEATQEWSERLAGLTGSQIQHGLKSWNQDWPPSSEEFRKQCEGKKKDPGGFKVGYIPEQYRNENDRTKSNKLLTIKRSEQQTESGKIQAAKLKDSLK